MLRLAWRDCSCHQDRLLLWPEDEEPDLQPQSLVHPPGISCKARDVDSSCTVSCAGDFHRVQGGLGIRTVASWSVEGRFNEKVKDGQRFRHGSYSPERTKVTMADSIV